MGRATSQSLTARPTPMAVGHLGGSSPPRRCLRVALDRARAGHRTPLDCRTGTCTHRYHKHFNQIFKLSGDLNLKKSIRIYAVFLSISLFVLIASGPTQSEPLNWERVTSSDVNQYEDWSHRQKDKYLNLSAFGDFDGDGKQDHAYLSKNVKEGKWGVFLETSRSGGMPRIVESGEIASLPRMFLQTQPAGTYPTLSCKYGSAPSANCGTSITLENESFAVISSEASSQTFFVRNGFVSSFYTSD